MVQVSFLVRFLLQVEVWLLEAQKGRGCSECTLLFSHFHQIVGQHMATPSW